MSKTTNKFSPEVRACAIQMVLDHERDYPSRWATMVSIAEKIGCSPPTLHEWVKETEVDSGKRVGVRKVWRQMRREGYDIARCTLERLMRDMGGVRLRGLRD